MAFDHVALDGAVFERLLQRAQVVVRHHHHHGQVVDVRHVVQLVLASEADGPDEVGRYRGVLEEAVAALVHGLR